MNAGKKLAEEGLADAKVARGFVAEDEPLGDVVVGVCLLGCLALCNGGKFGRRDEGAFEGDGVEGQFRFNTRLVAARLKASNESEGTGR